MKVIHGLRSLAFAVALLAVSAASYAQMRLTVEIAPPELPVYEQPLCPGDGYLWTPGYWGYADGDYYWVPGTWVMAPRAGLLWTPAYWGWNDGRYAFNEGYWGEHVGYYGGISYGYGYFGEGYEGGRWNGEHFDYNRSVTNVNVVNIHNVYNTTVIRNNESRVSYNGGNGGIVRRPTPQEETFTRERHVAPVAEQAEHAQAARRNPDLRASVNHGKPPIAATTRPGQFKPSNRMESKPAEQKALEGKVSQPRASETKAAETRTGEPKPATRKPVENSPTATHNPEQRPMQQRTEHAAPAHETHVAPQPAAHAEGNSKPKTAPKSEPKKPEGEPRPTKSD